MTLPIESGVPLPCRGAARMRYPWAEMQPGDSIVVPVEKRSSAHRAGVLWCRSHRPGATVVMRTEGDVARLWMAAVTYELTSKGWASLAGELPDG